MRAEQIERYIGLPYDPESFDCADLAALVQRELFGKTLSLPGRRQRMAAPTAAIDRYRGELARPIGQGDLRDGDIVVMRAGGFHVGTVVFISGMAWALHASATIGHSVLHRLLDLPAFGLRIEGFYRWN
jgi:hypothetical protein